MDYQAVYSPLVPLAPSFPIPVPTQLDSIRFPAPVYTILILGMVLFMFSNVMPGLLPDPAKFGSVMPSVLQAGFALCLIALLVQMTGLLPGVPQLHITYVHLAIAFLLFVMMWNHIVASQPEEPKKPSSSPSSSSSSSRSEPRKEEKREKKKEEKASVSAWDDLRAHPSAFLTTRLNKLVPWPFPMGNADRSGPELWWESGMPHHVGHFNRPESDVVLDKEAEAKKKKEEEDKKKKEEEKKKAEKAKEEEQAKAKAKAEKEAKDRQDEARRAKEIVRAKEAAAAAAAKKAIEDRQKQKVWRTKALAMIIGISLLSKPMGFVLLLLFSIQLVSQELNAPPPPQPMTTSSSTSTSSPSGSSSTSATASAAKKNDADPDRERAKRAEAEAAKAKEQAKKATASASRSSGEDKGQKSSSSSSSSKDRSISGSFSDSERSSSATSGEKSPSASLSSSSSSKDKSSSSSSSKGRSPTSSSSKDESSSSSSKPSSSSTSKSGSSSSSSSSSKDKDKDKDKDKGKPISGAAVKRAEGSETVTKSDPSDSHQELPPIGFGMHYIHVTDKDGHLEDESINTPSLGMAHPLMSSLYRQWAN